MRARARAAPSRGSFRNGVCPKGPDKEETSPEWVLTYERAKAAREVRLGAYYRLEPDISDYHAALNEIGAIYVSAQIHSHWDEPEDGRIKPGGEPRGGHAFVILGYDDTGFWVLNSWGPAWGLGGLAHWQYKDWASSVMDAWVLQLGVRAPDAFGAAPRATPSSTAGLFGFREPHRSDILGHFINIDDGRLVVAGKYGSPVGAEMQETVKRLTTDSANGGKGYHHLVLYAHGGLNALEDEAARIATWKRHDIFGRNTIYNFHLMWGSGFIDEVFGKLSQSAAGRVAGLFTDWLFEAGLGKQIGAYAWRNMKQDALMAFTDVPDYGGGLKGLGPLLKGLDAAGRRPKLHLVGHSAGAIVLGHLLAALPAFKLQNLELQSIHLMAPACTVKFFEEHYGPVLRGHGALPLQDKVYLYNLTEQLEQDDTVSANIPLLPSYSRSLLYLVSRAYEDKENASLAGMQVAAPGLPRSSRLGDQLRRRFGQDGGAEPRRVRQRRSNALHHHVARAGEDGTPPAVGRRTHWVLTLCRIACRRQFPVDLQLRRRTETGRGPLRPPTLGLDHRKAGRAGQGQRQRHQAAMSQSSERRSASVPLRSNQRPWLKITRSGPHATRRSAARAASRRFARTARRR